MSLGEDLIKKLNRKFEPSTTSQFRYRSNDVVVQADENGDAFRAFIGKANEKGFIKGDRYSRTIKKIEKERSLKIIGKETGRRHNKLALT